MFLLRIGGSNGEARDCKSLLCRFKSCPMLHNQFYATLAQLVEHLTCNEDVVSSNLTGGSILMCRDIAQPGIALALGARGRRFKSCYPDHMSTSSSQVRTPGFHPGNRSSNLRVDATLFPDTKGLGKIFFLPNPTFFAEVAQLVRATGLHKWVTGSSPISAPTWRGDRVV